MPSAGRKFLMAGRGGLNLTHSEPLPRIPRSAIGAGGSRISRAADRGVPRRPRCATGARRWGSRPLSAPAAGCFRRPSRHRHCCARGCGGWTRAACASPFVTAGQDGTASGRLIFQTPDGPRAIACKSAVLALGGASWPRLGSDGAWADVLAAKGGVSHRCGPANSGFTVAWSEIFKDRFEGQPLKGCGTVVRCKHSVRGEAMVTLLPASKAAAVYALSALNLREAVVGEGNCDAARCS